MFREESSEQYRTSWAASAFTLVGGDQSAGRGLQVNSSEKVHEEK